MSARTKIRDGLDPGALRDHRRFADLQRARDLAAQKFHRLAFVKNGLAVRSDQLDGLERHAGFPKRLREQFAQQEIQPGNGAGVRGRIGYRKNRCADFRRIGDRRRRHHLDAFA